LNRAVRWDDVGFAWPDGPRALDGVHLEVASGDVLLVVGDSGSGKSTLLRTVNGLVPHASGGRFRGVVVVHGRSIGSLRPRDMADTVGFVHQDPEAQFVVDHVEHDIAFALENLGADALTMRVLIDTAGTIAHAEISRAAAAGINRRRLVAELTRYRFHPALEDRVRTPWWVILRIR
jgi:energy-coupling factor transport system ATP-binding protein